MGVDGGRVFVGVEVDVGSGVLVGTEVLVCVTVRVGAGEVWITSAAPPTTAPVGVGEQAPANRDRQISTSHRVANLIPLPVLGFCQVELPRSTAMKVDRKGNSANTTQVNHKPVFPASRLSQVKRVVRGCQRPGFNPLMTPAHYGRVKKRRSKRL